MLRIAVVEDEDTYAETLLGYIRRYVGESKETISAERFSDGANFVDEYRGAFDIILLDIAMPHMNGLEVAKRIRAADENVCLIFITTLAKYAIRGYEVRALDFLVKPVAYELFRLKLKRAIEVCGRNETNTFCIAAPTGMSRVRFADIRYIESDKHYLLFHIGKDILRARGAMRDIRPRFERNGFVAIRNYTLVNLAYVEGFAGSEVTVDGEVLSIARSCKTEFLQALAAWVGKEP